MPLRPIARVSSRELKDFRANLREQEPIIITDLYRGSRIAEVDSIGRAAQEFGDIRLEIGRSYFDQHYDEPQSQAHEPDETLSLRDYFALLERVPGTDRFCREQALPPLVRSAFDLPGISRLGPESKPVCMIYAANDGLVAPLHFDLDQREVLFTEVLGRKRIYLVRPGLAARLCPIRNFCSFPVHRFAEEEREAFFAFNDAHTCLLEPGETLYIPKLWWHYLANVGVTLAFNVRFGLAPASVRLRTLPSNYLNQNVSRELVDPLTGKASDPRCVEQLLAAFYGDYPGPEERLHATVAALQEAYSSVCASSLQKPYLSGWFKALMQQTPAKEALYYGYYEPAKLPGESSEGCSEADLKSLQRLGRVNRMEPEKLDELCRDYGLAPSVAELKRREANILYTNLMFGRYREDWPV